MNIGVAGQLDPETREAFASLVENESVLVFEENVTPLKTLATPDNRYDNWYYPVPAGAGIRVHMSGNTYYGCTAGFSVKENGGHQVKYILTAGHCLDGRTGNSVVIGSMLVEMGKAGIEYDHDYSSADVGLINLSDQESTSSWILDSALYYGNKLVSADQLNDVEGLAVCASLGKSNAVKCGTVTNTNKNVTLSDDYGNTTYFVKQREVSIVTVKGDSGSPVFAGCSGCGKYVAAYGLLVGGGTTRSIVSYIGNIHSLLGTTTIKDDADPIYIY